MGGPLGLILVLLLQIILQSSVGVGLMGLVILGTYTILLLVVNSGFLVQFGAGATIPGSQIFYYPVSFQYHASPLATIVGSGDYNCVFDCRVEGDYSYCKVVCHDLQTSGIYEVASVGFNWIAIGY